MKNSILIFMILVWSCKGPNNEVDDKIKKVKKGARIEYYSNSNIKAILNYSNDSLSGECLFFYTNGNVKAKVKYHNGLEDGMAYYFYPSGVIDCKREWKMGRKVGYACDYYDTTGYTKAYMYYNSEGALLWRNTVDVNGKVIKEEGKGNKF